MKSKVEVIEESIIQNEAGQQAITSRISEAVKLQAATQEVYDNLRLERQSALVSNQDITKINAGLKQAQDTLDLHCDTVTGLNNELERLVNERKELTNALTVAVKQQFTDGLIALSGTYNSQAAELAKTVRSIFELRLKMGEDINHSKFVTAVPGWQRTALQIIPRLYLPGEKIPTLLTEQAFFDATFL
jgi:hypothetical protein